MPELKQLPLPSWNEAGGLHARPYPSSENRRQSLVRVTYVRNDLTGYGHWHGL